MFKDHVNNLPLKLGNKKRLPWGRRIDSGLQQKIGKSTACDSC